MTSIHARGGRTNAPGRTAPGEGACFDASALSHVSVERVADRLLVNITRRQTRTFSVSEREALHLAALLIGEVLGEPPSAIAALLTADTR